MKKLRLIICLLCITLFASACGGDKNPAYIKASNTESKLQIGGAQNLEFEWVYSPEEIYCRITNNSDTDYAAGYGTLEVFANGKWMMAKCQDPACIPEVEFSVPANSVSGEIPVFLAAYGNAFLPGRYRAVLELSECSDSAATASAGFYTAYEFTVE